MGKKFKLTGSDSVTSKHKAVKNESLESDSDDGEWEEPLESLEEAFTSNKFEDAEEGDYNDESIMNEDDYVQTEDNFKAHSGGEAREKTAEEAERDRVSRKEQKALLQTRKANKPNAPLVVRAKKIWEVLRQKSISKPEKEAAMTELMSLIQGKVKEVIFKHDASRIIQCALKYGSPAQREIIAKELHGEYAKVAQAHYGCFIISKILKYCVGDIRTNVIKDFYGKVRKLIRHKEASLIIGECYGSFANAAQKNALMEEFYGPEFAVFKTKEPQTLAQIFEQNPMKKDSILKYLRECLCSVLEKGTVNIGSISIIHKALLEYFTFAEEKSLTSMIELVKDHIVTILHTREGALVSQRIISLATPKDRKHIIKSLKGFVTKIALEQYGHAVLLSIFEAVDDAVLVQKAIVTELGKDVNSLAYSSYGSRVLLFLLTRRNRRYQPAFIIQELEALDEIRSKTCKKDDAAKYAQLSAMFVAECSEACEENVVELVRHKFGCQILLELAKTDGVTSGMLSSIAETARLTEGIVADTAGEFHAIKKLSAEQSVKEQQEKGIDMTLPPLLTRSATFLFKDIMTAQAEAGITASSNKAGHFSGLLAAAIYPNLDFWVEHITSSPATASGLVHVLMSCLETCSPELRIKLIKNISLQKIRAALKKVKEDAVLTAAGAKDGKKRKRSPTATSDSEKKPLPLELLCTILQS